MPVSAQVAPVTAGMPWLGFVSFLESSPPYTAKAIKATGLVEETKALLRAWMPGESTAALRRRAREQAILGRSTASRSDDVVAHAFNQRFLAGEKPAAPYLKSLLEEKGAGRWFTDLCLLYAARADVVLREAISIYASERRATGRDYVDTPSFIHFIEDQEIEKVIDYTAADPDRLEREIGEYVVTERLEESFRRFIEAYESGVRRGDVTEVGIWVSGFYGSGKSSFTKYLGFALDPERRLGDIPFLDRLTAHFRASDLQQIYRSTAASFPATVVLLDLARDQLVESMAIPITNVLYAKVLQRVGYSKVPKLADVEVRLDEQGRLDQFRVAYRERFPGKGEWDGRARRSADRPGARGPARTHVSRRRFPHSGELPRPAFSGTVAGLRACGADDSFLAGEDGPRADHIRRR